MYSGIVQGVVLVVSLEQKEGLSQITLDMGDLVRDLKQGASVSIAGVCLTVTSMDGSCVSFDAMGETLLKTTLGSLVVGSRLNIERSMRAEDEVGGHRVSGHVTGMATITSIERPPNNCIMTFECPSEWMAYILPKGFIALDGCSLTIVDVTSNSFTVHFIPETLQRTMFGEKKIGDKVNLEIDSTTQIIVETVRRAMENLTR